MSDPSGGRRRMGAVAILAAALVLSACATLSGTPRAGISTEACIRNAIAAMPADLPDKQAHCRASGSIARHCSTLEAWLAGGGKELKDLLGRGDAEWADLLADRAGIACGRRTSDDVSLADCCALAVGVSGAPATDTAHE